MPVAGRRAGSKRAGDRRAGGERRTGQPAVLRLLAAALLAWPLAGHPDVIHEPAGAPVVSPGQLRGAARALPAWKSIPQILADAPDYDWRTPDPERLLYMDLERGRVVIELAPRFAPHHVDNVKALVRDGWFDGLSINRVQDNYVAQWGDPDEDHPRPMQHGVTHLAPEFTRASRGLAFRRLPERDAYALEVGFVDGFPVARNGPHGQTWLAHCYGMVGAGRDVAADSGSGAELYAVIGHAPRHLDRNVTLLGRVLVGMEWLSSLPRGTGDLGFYTDPGQRVPIRRMRLEADLPEGERLHLQVLRTDSATFSQVVESRRNRRDDWTKAPAGHIELCNVPLPVRHRP